MTIYTQIDSRQSLLDDYRASFGDTLGSSLSEGFRTNYLSQINRSRRLALAEEGLPDDFTAFDIPADGELPEPAKPLLPAERARDRIKEAGVDLTVPDEGIREDALDMLVEHKRKQSAHADTVARGPSGFIAGAAQLGASFVGGAADPISVLSAFVPVVGPARYGAMLAGASGIMGRTGVRVGVGAAEGAVGEALLLPLAGYTASRFQDEFGMAEVLGNIAFGGVLGGGLHAGLGAAGDAVSAGRSWRTAQPAGSTAAALQNAHPQARVAALNTGVTQAVNGQGVDVAALPLFQPVELPADVARTRKPLLAESRPQENLARAETQSAAMRDEDIVNPIDRSAAPEEKARQLAVLTEQNKPLVDDFIAKLDQEFGTESKSNVKAPEKVVEKGSRPSILAKKPWHAVEHLRDSFRFKTVLEDVRDLPKIAERLASSGFDVVKADVDKALAPLEWGWRIVAFDLRLPNGQLVEYYLPVRELEEAKAEGHLIFEKWRNENLLVLPPDRLAERERDLQASRDLYQAAWDAYLARSGATESELRASLTSASASVSSSTRRNPPSSKSPDVMLVSGAQTPSEPRSAANLSDTSQANMSGGTSSETYALNTVATKPPFDPNIRSVGHSVNSAEAHPLFDREAVQAGDDVVAKALDDDDMPEVALQEALEDVARLAKSLAGTPLGDEADALVAGAAPNATAEAVAPETTKVTNASGETFATKGEPLPPRGVAPANLGENGVVYIGKPNSVHFELSEQFPFTERGRWQEDGFATPDGQFLTREQALQWVTTNEKKVRPSENVEGMLDALDYREQVPMAKRAIESAPPEPPQVEAARELAKAAPKSIPAFEAPAATPDRPAGVFMFDAGELLTDAKRFQYKDNGDAEGVTTALKGVTKWDPAKANQLIVWQAADGKLFVADGHQRSGLARRLIAQGHETKITIPGILYRETDGFSPGDVRSIAAAKNIAEGSGSPIDGAKVLRTNPELMDGSMPLSRTESRQSFELARLNDEAFRMVTNEVVTYQQAAVVGRIIPDDGARQVAAIEALVRFEPRNEVEASVLVERVAQAELAKRDAGAQGGMFDDMMAADSTAGEEMKIVAKAIAELKKDKALFARVLANAERIEETGSKIERGTATSVAQDAEVFAKTISTNAYSAGPIRTALVTAAKDLKSGQTPIAGAVRSVLDAVRGEAENLVPGRIRDSGSGGAEAQGGAAGLAPEAEAGADGAAQSLIPGVAPVTDKNRLDLAASKPLRGGNAPAGGMFDDNARAQTDLMDLAGTVDILADDAEVLGRAVQAYGNCILRRGE